MWEAMALAVGIGVVVLGLGFAWGYMFGWQSGYLKHKRLEDSGTFISYKDEDGNRGYIKFYPRKAVWGGD